MLVYINIPSLLYYGIILSIKYGIFYFKLIYNPEKNSDYTSSYIIL